MTFNVELLNRATSPIFCTGLQHGYVFLAYFCSFGVQVFGSVGRNSFFGCGLLARRGKERLLDENGGALCVQ